MDATRRKIGETRRVRVKLGPGTYKSGYKEYITIDEEVEIDQVQTYKWRYDNIEENSVGEPRHPMWFHHSYDWETVSPVGKPKPAPKPKEVRIVVHKPKWYVRLWWWITGSKLPKAKVVK